MKRESINVKAPNETKSQSTNNRATAIVVQGSPLVYAISDLHLAFQTEKPMNVFGEHWDNYEYKIRDDWNAKVGPDDIGIIAGDLSWAMKMEDATLDFDYIKNLNGTKIIIRGNHDYWWKTIGKVRTALRDGNVIALQTDAVRVNNIVFAGTRGWKVPERRHKQDAEDKKIFDREVIRLELALKDAKQKIQPGDKLVVVIHYPPFNSLRDDSPFTKLMQEHRVDACVYGHLHSKGGRVDLVTKKNGVTYYLTSCDILNFTVAEIKL